VRIIATRVVHRRNAPIDASSSLIGGWHQPDGGWCQPLFLFLWFII
jgi:hypothetical protein